MGKVLEVENLVQYFPLSKSVKIEDGKMKIKCDIVNAVNGVGFTVEEGEVFSLVGESGCGKSTTARTVMKLLEPKDGVIIFDGEDITDLSWSEMLEFRSKMQMIFQDPYASLNPKKRVKDIIVEPMLYHKKAANKSEALEKCLVLLEKVGLNPEQANRYPHQFSGGQRQRIGIARALAIEPRFIVADEPVSALDVSVQAQILNLLMDLKDEYNFSCLFIAHDLSVVKHITDRLGVMYLGMIVESGTKEKIFDNPLHPYTKALFSAVPSIDNKKIVDFIELTGELPSPVNVPNGCYFHDRCPYVMEKCRKLRPEMIEVCPGHSVACHLTAEEVVKNVL